MISKNENLSKSTTPSKFVIVLLVLLALYTATPETGSLVSLLNTFTCCP